MFITLCTYSTFSVCLCLFCWAVVVDSVICISVSLFLSLSFSPSLSLTLSLSYSWETSSLTWPNREQWNEINCVMATIHTCSSLICNKYFHHVQNTTFHLQVVAGIHYTVNMPHAIASQQLIDKSDPNCDSERKKTTNIRTKLAIGINSVGFDGRSNRRGFKIEI